MGVCAQMYVIYYSIQRMLCIYTCIYFSNVLDMLTNVPLLHFGTRIPACINYIQGKLIISLMFQRDAPAF